MNRTAFPWSNLSVRLPDDAPLPRGAAMQPDGMAWAELAETMESLRISPEQLRRILQGLPAQELDGPVQALPSRLAEGSTESDLGRPADWRRGWILVESDSEDAA